MAQIICNDMTLAYDGRPVIEGLSFSVSSGDYLCIVGANGTGKSTLIRALLGLITPASGTVTFGEGLTMRDVGYLPQQTPVQRDFPASVLEIVLTGHLGRHGFRPFYTRKEKAAAGEVLAELGIADLAHASYRALSGGQQQRVLLARALLAAKRMLLLDEPTASLDPVATREFYALIRRLCRDKGVTVLMVTHDLSALERDADHILHLGEHPPFFGTFRSYAESEAGKAYLGSRNDTEPASGGCGEGETE